MSSDSMNHGPAGEGESERVLRAGLRTNALSPEALQRIREATQNEWRSVTRPPARRGWRVLTAAASIVVAAGFGAAYVALTSGASDGAVLGQVAAFDAPGIVETRLFRSDLSLVAASKLHAGQTFDARGASLVTLSGGGNLRMARATAVKVEGEDTISLERGELYVDIPPGSRTNTSFRVRTDAGEFRHEGTQFALAIVAGETRLRVREGRVLWRASAGDSVVDSGTEVVIDRDGKVTRRPVAKAGHDWAWTDSMAPDVAIDNRPLIEFLEWFARETGRNLVIDTAARSQAGSIRMHGDVRGLTVTEALSAVMATTTLRYELPEGVIRVSSARESKTPPA